MENKFLQLALILSLTVHLAVATVLWLRPSFQMPTPPTVLTMEFSEPEQDFVEIPKKSALENPKTKQFVDDDYDILNDEDDPYAKYMAEHNQHVEKETVASKVGGFKNSDNNGSGKGDAKSEASNDNLLLDDDSEGPAQQALKAKTEKTDVAGDLGVEKDVSQSNDNLRDKEKGLKTMLNTKEFVYFAYYKQIKTRLTQYWELKIKEKMVRLLKEGRNIASDEEHVTRLFIVLNKDGTLVGVQVLNKSGTRDLDDAAIEAFREAAPFPNPPPGIMDKDGTVKIRWDLVLEPEYD